MPGDGGCMPAGCQVKPLTQVKAFTVLCTGPSAHRSCQLPTGIPPQTSCLEFSHPEASVAAALPRATPPTAHPNLPWGQLSTSSNLYKSKPELFPLMNKDYQHRQHSAAHCVVFRGISRTSPLSYIPSHMGTGLCLITQSNSLALRIHCSVNCLLSG